MILRHVITTNPPRARYYDTVTGRTWFDNDVFGEAGIRAAEAEAETVGVFERALSVEMRGLLTDLQNGTVKPSDLRDDGYWDDPRPAPLTAADAIRSYMDRSSLLLTGENPSSLEAILAEYHDHVLKCLEEGESWE